MWYFTMRTYWFIPRICNASKTKSTSKTKKKWIKRRVLGEPFQHIIGKAPFYGRDFIINKDVLIPRPETELIIDILKKMVRSLLFDVGTGSGCIAITCAIENILI